MIKRLSVVLLASMFSMGVCAAIEDVHVSTGGAVSVVEQKNEIRDIATALKQGQANYAGYLRAEAEAKKLFAQLAAFPEGRTVEKAQVYVALDACLERQRRYLDGYVTVVAVEKALLEELQKRQGMPDGIHEFVKQIMELREVLLIQHWAKLKVDKKKVTEIKKEVAL